MFAVFYVMLLSAATGITKADPHSGSLTKCVSGFIISELIPELK